MPDAVPPPNRVRSYDLFAERDRGAAHLPEFDAAFEKINDRFCSSLRLVLQQRLRRPVKVTAAAPELVKHRDLMERLTTPTYLAIIAVHPLPGIGLLACDVQLVVTMVESRFGGNGRFPVSKTSQEFSAFEQKSMRRVTETTLAEFALAWEPFQRIDPEIVRYETKPLFAAFAAPDDLLVLNAYNITIAHGSGRMLIALPCASIRPVLEQPATGTAVEPIKRDQRWSDALQTSVTQASITLNVELAGIEISVAELMTLVPGNIFEMPRPDTVIVEANGVPLFRGRWGRYGG